MSLDVQPATADLWPALDDLFGAKRGASNGCWCMYWRIGPGYAQRSNSDNRADFLAAVERGPPPGLLAFEGRRAVGWCQATPRNALAHLAARPPADARPAADWAISCFYVRRGHRRRGVTAALVEAAAAQARAAGAASIEAYPVDLDAPKPTRNTFTGYASTFRRLGFREVGRGRYGRVVMRLELA